MDSVKRSQSSDSSGSFVEEIDLSEIEFLEFLGQGAYGFVKKAIWRNTHVAVKMIHGDSEKKAFLMELKQLSRVTHENIIKFYGASTNYEQFYLVEELADHGSLENVLHKRPRSIYKAAHAISWLLQCAKGVEYLHAFKPKPLVHRDLKPPNLLLVDLGRKLKICDFGTACDLSTYMTNNQGSAAWMAPEVFEGRSYNEKCDVFSWGIILWEVLTRRKPFHSYALNNVFATLWAVHNGARPPLIQNCPKPIELLMTRCWHKDPQFRPSMTEVVGILTHLSQFFKGADEPLQYEPEPVEEEDEIPANYYTDVTYKNAWGEDTGQMGAGVEGEGDLVRIPHYPNPKTPRVREDPMESLKSAPATLWSDEDSNGVPRCFSFPEKDAKKLRKPNSTAHQLGNGDRSRHRRTGSYDTALLSKFSGQVASEQSSSDCAETPKSRQYLSGESSSVEVSPAGLPMAHLFLEPGLQPLRPCPTSDESMRIFQDHCKLAEQYLRMQEEIKLLRKRKQNVMDALDQDVKEQNFSSGMQDEYEELLVEKKRLEEFHKTLRIELEKVRKQNRHRRNY